MSMYLCMCMYGIVFDHPLWSPDPCGNPLTHCPDPWLVGPVPSPKMPDWKETSRECARIMRVLSRFGSSAPNPRFFSTLRQCAQAVRWRRVHGGCGRPHRVRGCCPGGTHMSLVLLRGPLNPAITYPPRACQVRFGLGLGRDQGWGGPMWLTQELPRPLTYFRFSDDSIIRLYFSPK